ncbi:alpha/beta hydrolase [Roseomonas populi]|uniref:Alpha/beta hydrolase n=1 Tax=Roseomonas populi TaxID=3121582 RepID=A0ABT1X4I7_9PROT|nr:alpha/beta hydrolase [Roseomonas pecuniae]MCR0983017.1 alpha/beta hydrolase [Roseomonas pecuniae]
MGQPGGLLRGAATFERGGLGAATRPGQGRSHRHLQRRPGTCAISTLSIDEDDLAEARKFNRKLDWLPRFKLRNRFDQLLIQSLLRLSQTGSDRAVRRVGLDLEERVAEADGLRVPVRILRSRAPVKGVVLDIHGGGWAIGNARVDDGLNSRIIHACGVAVVSVDYRLAGRVPVEELIKDCTAAARWLLEGGLPEYAGMPVVFTGESAGGHLAVATLLRLKAWPDLLRRVRGAVLHYGVYDLAGTRSVREAGRDTLVLPGRDLKKALCRLTPDLNDEERRAPDLSPLYADLRGLPPALMFTGTLDPLRDDTLELAERWRTAGGEVELHLVPESPHGLIHFSTRIAAKVRARGHAWIRDRLR